VYTYRRPSAGPEAGLLTLMIVCVTWAFVVFVAECVYDGSMIRNSDKILLKLSFQMHFVQAHPRRRHSFFFDVFSN
jgi:hypothetical protein